MVPVRHVVPRPHRAQGLCAGKECPAEHERAARGRGLFAGELRSALQLGIHRGLVEVVTVLVVHITVLDLEVAHGAEAPEHVPVVFRHRQLRPIKHAGLVHVVPSEQCREIPRVPQELPLPEFPHAVPEDVEVARGARPAVPHELRLVLVFHEEVFAALGLLVEAPGRVGLDVRVHDRHHLPALVSQRPDHPPGVGEVARVPRHVLLPVRVLDVQPQDIIGDAVLVEVGVHFGNVGLGVVVPSALVVPEGEQGRQHALACDQSVAAGHVLRRGAEQEVQVQSARLGNPLRSCAPTIAAEPAPGLLHVHEHLRWIEPEDP
mmetsp:Transcript_3626/g.9896  ORF Transcript_3626/g.9896 Transcript_3626/m.9896 type:complete len:319 (-) Transcript_3626:592-1548(-)